MVVYRHVGVPNSHSRASLPVVTTTQDEFGSRSEFEERATPYHFANALAILKASGEQEAAQEMFQVGDVGDDRMRFPSGSWPPWPSLGPVDRR